MSTSSDPTNPETEHASRVSLRDESRYPVDWEAAIRCPDWRVAEEIAAGNISRGGMFLRTTREFEVGARVEITLELPDRSGVKLVGKVRHVNTPATSVRENRPAGIGVEIDSSCRNELLALAEIARLRRERSPSGAGQHAVPRRVDAQPTPPPERAVRVPGGPVADAVGIDLGTSFSTLAVAAGDTVQPVPDAHGRTQHPSLVFYGGAGTRGPLVGWDARKLQAQHPERTVAGIKRLLGQRYSAPDISAYLQQLPFPCTAGDDDGISLLFDAAPIPAAEVSATVLRHLRQLAETQLGKQIGRAVLAHPAGFDERRQASLLQAAQLAGIEPMQLIPEALAAGLAFGHGNSGNEVVGVYDLGTTFEFSVLELSATHFRVLGSAGDPWLGGDAIDQSMAKAVANTFWRRTAIELHAIGPDWQRLMLTCERAKRRLSTDEVTLIDVPQMAESTDLSQQVDRGAMGRICGPVLDRSLQLCRGVLEGAGLGVGDLDGLVLAGGITRLPHVRQRVEAFFEREGSQAEVHPEDAVALGSALFAARLAGHPARVARSIDV